MSQVFSNPETQELLLVFRDFLNSDDQGFLLHRFDEDLSIPKGKYLNIFEYFFNASNSLHQVISQAPLYKGTRFGSDGIAIVPNVYTGTVFVLNTDSYEEQLFGERINEIVEEYDFKNRERLRNSGEKGFASTSGPSGRFFYKKTGSNIGLAGNSNFLLQFYVLFEGKKIIPFVTIYSQEGKVLSTTNLQDSPIKFIKNGRISVTPHFLDEDNNLYVSDYSFNNSHPAVLVFKTNLSEFLQVKN